MKKALSVILALALIFSISSVAFSAESGDTIIRVDSDGNETAYEYGGEFVLGSNVVNYNGNKYWIFTPDKSGVYAFENDNTIFTSVNVTYGKIGEESAKSALTDNYELYYFEADEPQYIVSIPFATADSISNSSCELRISYFGEVKDLIYDENRILIMNEDVAVFEDRYYIFSFDDSAFKLTFTETDKEEKLMLVTVKDPLKSGENTVEIDILGKLFTVNLKVKSIENYISGFELPGYYRFSGYTLYNGDIIERLPGYLIVKYTDGSSEKVAVKKGLFSSNVMLDIPEIGQKNARFHYVEGNLMLDILNHDFDLGVKTRKADVLMNTAELLENISSGIADPLFLAMLYSASGEKDFFTALTEEILSAKEYIAQEIRMYKEAL